MELVRSERQDKKAYDTVQAHMVADRKADIVIRDVGAGEVQVGWAHI